MSSVAVGSAIAAAIPQPNFHSHKKGSKFDMAGDATTATGNSIGQLPVGAGQNLLSSLIASLQAAAAQRAGSTSNGGSAVTTASTGGVASTSGAAAATSSSNPALPGFLGKALQNLQNGGAASGSSVGANVNIKA